MSLQASIGNAAVGQLLGASARASREQATPVDGRTQEAIDAAADGGQALSGPLQHEMQGVAGGPLGDVRVHQGTAADALTRQLGATAFTQGRDVFLRSDRNPSTLRGRETLAHELSHVAQGSTGAGAVLREPDVQQMDSSSETVAAVARIVLNGGELKGESEVEGHGGELDFRSLGFGGGRGVTGGQSGGGPAVDLETVELNGIRFMDRASPRLSEAAAKGTPVTEASFVFLRKGPDGKYSEVMSFDLKDGFLATYQASSEEGRGVESVTLLFKKDK